MVQPATHGADRALAALLRQAKTIAVVGLSADPTRASFRVAEFLQARGYAIIPVNPNVSDVLGVPAVASLSDLRQPVDIVDVFRRPEHCAEIAALAVAIGARVLWLQLGIVSDEAMAIAGRAGLTAVQDRCLKVEWQRLIGATP
ncbi:MAG: CoA-binding protein [Actinobacteria bacterium]|nr:CoA-binding protein [Actinomycetota bacterium]